VHYYLLSFKTYNLILNKSQHTLVLISVNKIFI